MPNYNEQLNQLLFAQLQRSNKQLSWVTNTEGDNWDKQQDTMKEAFSTRQCHISDHPSSSMPSAFCRELPRLHGDSISWVTFRAQGDTSCARNNRTRERVFSLRAANWEKNIQRVEEVKGVGSLFFTMSHPLNTSVQLFVTLHTNQKLAKLAA